MLVDVYDCCHDDEKYSDNGINLTIRRCIPDDEINLKFTDDGGKVIFEVSMEWKIFFNMIKIVSEKTES